VNIRPVMVTVTLVALLARPDWAQEVVACQTPNGARTTTQLADEVRAAGYGGPWDTATVAAAYGRASGGLVTCSEPAPNARPTAVVFVAGYGSSLASAFAMFSPLRTALAARNPNVAFVHYSYTGTNFSGCVATPAPYRASDTAQDIEISKRILGETLSALKAACDVDRIAIVGHSLGGLIAFQALAEQSVPDVSDLITVDSPLGGVPLPLIRTCIDAGLCADGAVAGYLAGLYSGWAGTAVDNASRAAALGAAATRVSAWGSQSDCFYDVALCSSFPRNLAAYDARETQWVGIPHAVRKDYPFTAYVWNIPASHMAVLLNSATEMAAELLP
jgi:pimeloyl-ACP methyl ester carboxylesterase